MATFEEAAQARSAGVRAHADRPSQRRSAEDPLSTARSAYVRIERMEIRDASDASGKLSFEGYASVFNAGYQMYDSFGPYTEVISPNAFEGSLNRADLDVPLVLGHDDMRRIARTTNGTLQLAEDESGLKVLAQLDPADPDVAYIAPKLRSGLIDEMSFKFRINAGQWNNDFSEYHISDVDIQRGDVSIVGYGANPNTKGSGLAAPAGADSGPLQFVSAPELPAVLIEDWEVKHRLI